MSHRASVHILLQGKPGQGWKGEAVSSWSDWGCHSVGFGGLGFIFCCLLCLGLSLFIPQVAAHPVSRLSCHTGI